MGGYCGSRRAAADWLRYSRSKTQHFDVRTLVFCKIDTQKKTQDFYLSGLNFGSKKPFSFQIQPLSILPAGRSSFYPYFVRLYREHELSISNQSPTTQYYHKTTEIVFVNHLAN